MSFNKLKLQFEMHQVSYTENFPVNVFEVKLQNNSLTKILLHLRRYLQVFEYLLQLGSKEYIQ